MANQNNKTISPAQMTAILEAFKYYNEGETFTPSDLSAKRDVRMIHTVFHYGTQHGYFSEEKKSDGWHFTILNGAKAKWENDTSDDRTNAACRNAKQRQKQDGGNDEYYTRKQDVRDEVLQYREQFKDKFVFCNCNDSIDKAFFWTFRDLFVRLGLKKLVGIEYHEDGHGIMHTIEADPTAEYMSEDRIVDTILEGNGGFETEESLTVLKECDIVCTNPPFSKARALVKILMDEKKKFLIICNKNIATYKESAPLFYNRLMWGGINKPDKFIDQDGNIVKKLTGLCKWITNMENNRVIPFIHNKARYYNDSFKFESYDKYDNYDAINVDRVDNIPDDYNETMGIVSTFMIDNWNPEQFEIIGFRKGHDGKDLRYTKNGVTKDAYSRVLIRRIVK